MGAAPPRELRARLAGRYVVERLLGEGGMGSVFLAREVALDRLVAIKVIRARLAADEEFRTRLRNEARIAASLSHPHVVPIHRLDDVDGMLVLVMGYVESTSLRDRLRAGPVPLREGLGILRDVAWALAHAHAAGVVHRDVKPDNVLIERSTGRAVVADFGIAARGESQDASGTRAYMSPEPAQGLAVDGRSDLYSLGVTARELLPANPPGNVADLVRRLVEQDPALRPQSAKEVADSLAALVEGARVPPDLRAWVDAPAVFDTGFVAVLALLMVPSFVLPSPWPPIVGLLYPAVKRLLGLRALLQAGHSVKDLLDALDARLDEGRAREVPESRWDARLRRGRRASVVGALLGILGIYVAIVENHALQERWFDAIVWMGLACSVVGLLSLAVTSIMIGLSPSGHSMSSIERSVLRVRRAFYVSAWGRGLAALLGGSSRTEDDATRVEGRLATAATQLIRARGKVDSTLATVVTQLEHAARLARRDPDSREVLTDAVAHLERLRLALESEAELEEPMRAARAFLDDVATQAMRKSECHAATSSSKTLGS